jgi:hypothetical protein
MNANDIMLAWNFILSIIVGIVGFIVKDKFEEVNRLGILLNRTREEIARDNVTQAELDRIVTHLDSRFSKLESKIDELIKQHHAQ